MNYRLGTLGLIAAMVLSMPTQAQEEGGGDSSGAAAGGVKASLGDHYYVSPMFNYLKAAHARGTDDGYGGQIAIGKGMTPGLNLELTAQYLSADAKKGLGSGSASLTSVGIGAMVFPLNVLPDLYIPISLQRGQVKKNPGVIPDYSTTVFDVGLGYLLGLGNFGNTYLHGASLRTELRYRMDAHGREQAGDTSRGQNKAFYEGIAAIGLLIPIGASAPPAAAAPEPVPAAAEVVPVVEAPPAEPAPEPAPAPEPTCKTPVAGEPIDLNGCKTGDAVVLKGVNFELDSARLMPNAKTILDGVSDALLAQQGIKAEIGGYTSSEGKKNHNQKLSERRAASVKKYLVGRGVATDRLSTKGYGPADPVADNSTNEGRELNRRVQLKVTDSGSGAAAPAAEAAPAAAPAADAAPAAEAPAADATAPAADAAAPAEAAPADASAAPAAEAAPAEAAPADAAAPAADAPADASAPEVQNAQPAQ